MRTKIRRVLLGLAVTFGLVAATALPAAARIASNHSEASILARKRGV
jgi:hypothetical protein